jgi:hypothetical protein
MRSTKSHTTANSVSLSVWKSNLQALPIGTTPLTPRVRTEWLRSRRIRSKRGRLNGICPAHPEGEGDVTFRVRSYDGLDYSPVEVRKYKLNLVAPTTLVNSPADGTSHTNGKVTFTGTSSDPYSGTWGSDIKSIWFDINGPNGYTANFDVSGSTAWAYDWIFQELQTGQYDFRIWASDSDFCNTKSSWVDCEHETRTININTDNAIPFVQLSEPLNSDILRASDTQLIQGVALDNDGLVTRVEISIFDLASGATVNNGP